MFCIKWKLIVALYFLNLRVEAIPSGSQKKKMADMHLRRNKFNSRQSYYIKVAQGVIYMEQNMRFGLILGRLAILKNIGPIMNNF